MNIIELTPPKKIQPQDSIQIRIIDITFEDKTSAHGLLLVDNCLKTYVYKIVEVDVYQIIKEILSKGEVIASDIMKRCYLNKYSIIFYPSNEIYWDEYEHAFEGEEYYKKPKQSVIIEFHRKEDDNYEENQNHSC